MTSSPPQIPEQNPVPLSLDDRLRAAARLVLQDATDVNAPWSRKRGGKRAGERGAALLSAAEVVHDWQEGEATEEQLNDALLRVLETCAKLRDGGGPATPTMGSDAIRAIFGVPPEDPDRHDREQEKRLQASVDASDQGAEVEDEEDLP